MSKITDFVITNFWTLAKIYGVIAITVCITVAIFLIWIAIVEEKEHKIYDEEDYIPETEGVLSAAETVIFTAVLAIGCGIAWIGIPVLIIGILLQEKISKKKPELMGKMFDEEEENK